jgi:RHS repeat-associated protein
VATREGATLRYVHQDSLGSTSTMSAADGTADSSISYFPFGNCRFSQGNLGTDKLFTGQRLDATGLYYYNARYYDATIGRFTSPDNNVSQPFNPQNLNRYSYCLNNPLKYIDPSGRDQIIETGGVNDNGDTWYTISDGQGNLLAIATGIDDLAQKMNDCEAVTREVDLPLGQAAADYINNEGQSTGGQATTSAPTTAGQVMPPTPPTPQPTLPVGTTTPTTQKNSANNISASLGPAKSNQRTIFGIPLKRFGGIVLETFLDIPLAIAIVGGVVTGTLPGLIIPILAYEAQVAPFHILAAWMFFSD